MYILASWAGFAIGHLSGQVLQMDLLKLGPLYLLSASVGSWIAILLSWWLADRSS
jgi:hypothetical protein